MRVPPASRGSSGPNSLLILIFLLSTTLFCGMAGAETMVITCPYGQTDPVCLPWGVITVFIDESSGGDLGQRFVTGEYECNYEMLNYNTPRLTGCENIINSPATVTLPFTIPDGVNLSRMYTRPYISFGGFGDGGGGTNLPGCDAVAPWWGCEDPVYYINDVEMTDWQVGSWDFGRVDPAILHTGENTLKIHSAPLWTYIDYQGYSGGPFYQGYVEIDHLYVTLQTYLDPSAKPELLDLTITPEMLVTGHDITISPVVKPGTPDWEILGISYYVTDINTGAQELHRALPDTSNLTFRPGPGAYGRKWLIAKMHIRDGLSGHQEISEFRVPIHIYFDKGRYPDFVDDDGNDKPNWFEYWMKDGAVPGLDATVTYNATGTGYGVSFPDGSVELEPLAATMHYNTAIVIPSTTLSPTGESFGGPTVSGIDCAAEVVAHENYHSWVSEQWTTAWSGLTDSDYDPSPITFDGNLMYYDDALPDIYELNVSLTDEFSLTDTYELRNLKSPVYFFYGDQEYMAMRAGNGSRGIPENDWGYPGKQAPRNDGIAFSPPIRQSCAGMCDMVSQGLPEGVLPGVIETPADTNGNSLYDTLTSSNDITINRTGLYEIAAVLSGGAGQEVVSIQRNQSTFATGNYSIASVFPGTDISSAGIDGPYTVTLTWRHEYQENGDPSFIFWQTTGTYVSTDFEPVSAGFASTATASPASRNLSAVTPLTINKDGEYTIEGYLQDPDGVQIAYAADTATFTTGAANADLVFDGNAIAANNRDGTYALVNFRILDAAGTTISRLADAGTVSIDASDYGNTVAILTDSYSASGTQQNSDGRYEILLVTSAITVPAEGRYYYSASLFDEEGGYIQTFEGTTGVLSVGAATLNLLFSGKDIYTNRVNGTFSVHSLEVYGPTGSDRRSHPFTTGSYDFTEFAGPPVMITGNVTDYPVDLDGDLLYDVIRVGFDVETGTFSSGTATIYLLADMTVPGANQTGVTNTLIAQSGTYNPLLEQQMTHHVTLDFPGTTINGMGIDGPYDLTLLQARGGASTDYYTESYSTAAYDHTLFEPAAILMGTVSNEIGQPLEGVDISADGKNTVTNGGGFYRLFYPTGRSMGVLALPSAALNMSSDYKVLSVSPGTPTYWNITLFSPARVYGTVTAENGTILTEGSVCSDGPTDYCFHLDWWSNGSYQLPNLKNGTYDSIQYTLPGSNLISDQRDTLILPGENRAWNITAYDKRSLEVTVSDIYGNPHGEAEVSITEGPITTTGWGSEPETDAAGVYTFQSLMPGNYTMVVSPNWTYRDLLITNTTNFTIEPADSAVTQNIILMPEPAEPVAGDFISCNTTEGPPPLTVSFADRASGYPTAWLWDFGDGVNSTERRPVHTYTDYGVYNITLTVSNPSGSDTGYFEEWIRVEEEPVPEVQFATGTLDPGASGLVSVSANTIPFQASRLVLNISFDPAVVQFNNAERYGSLDWDIDTTDIDNVAGTAQITVNIGGGPVPQNVMNPFANINFTAVGFGGEESLITADPADWLYFNSGWQYNPLSVTNGSIIINGGGSALPVADFTANLTSGSSPLSVAFDSSLSDVVSPTAYLWTFGDGNTSVLADPVHRYEVVGTHNVALQITNSSGSNTTTMTGYITVTSALPAPVAGFSADITSGDAPLTVAFTSTSTGSIDSYAWDFGDGQTSTSINPSNTYASAGVYTANLTVTNTGGSNSATSSITVTSPVLPVPVVTANATSGTVPMAVQFTSASSVVTSPTTYLWNFGDGNTSVQANPSHSYAVAGTYNVALSITNSSGTNVTTMTGYITASPAPLGVLPLPAFTADTTSGAVPLTVQFSSAPSDAVSPTGYLWTFGDGSTSVLENPSHGYTTVGVYGVSLRIANSSGFNTTTRARYISTHKMVGTNTSLPSNSTITGDQISINLTGSSDTEVNGDQIILNNQGGFDQIIFFTSGVTNTTGNLTGTVTGVQLTTPLMTAAIPEGAVTFQANISASSYNSGGEINFTFVGADENLTAAYQSLLGSQLNETALVFEITATGMDSVTGSVLTFTVPDAFRERNSGGIAVIWTHAGTSTVLTATYLGSSGGISTYQITVPGGFSTFGVVGMGTGTSPPAPSSPASPSSVDSSSFSSYSDSSPVSLAEPVTGTQTVNVGGSSAIRQVTVTGTGIHDLVVSAYSHWSPTPGIPELTVPVYQYVEINPARYTTITSAVIRFSVPQQWVDEKQVTADTIELYHYTAGQWHALPTHWEKTGNGQMYFTAESNGFSLFAIGVRSAGDAATVPESRSPQTFGDLAGSPTTGPVKISSANTGQSPIATETVPVQSQPDTVPGYMVPVLIAGAVAAILFGSVVLVRRWWIRRQNPALFRDYD